MIRYIIVGTYRSGTTAVHSCLEGHPEASALSDEARIYPFFTRGISTFTFGDENEIEKSQGHIRLFDALAQISVNNNTKACGL